MPRPIFLDYDLLMSAVLLEISAKIKINFLECSVISVPQSNALVCSWKPLISYAKYQQETAYKSLRVSVLLRPWKTSHLILLSCDQ